MTDDIFGPQERATARSGRQRPLADWNRRPFHQFLADNPTLAVAWDRDGDLSGLAGVIEPSAMLVMEDTLGSQCAPELVVSGELPEFDLIAASADEYATTVIFEWYRSTNDPLGGSWIRCSRRGPILTFSRNSPTVEA